MKFGKLLPHTSAEGGQAESMYGDLLLEKNNLFCVDDEDEFQRFFFLRMNTTTIMMLAPTRIRTIHQ
jgi:hypothetical protein